MITTDHIPYYNIVHIKACFSVFCRSNGLTPCETPIARDGEHFICFAACGKIFLAVHAGGRRINFNQLGE